MASVLRWAPLLVLAVAAFIVLVPKLFPAARMSLWLMRARRNRRRGAAENMKEVAAFHDQLPADVRTDAIDDRVWADLNLNEVFRSLDHTESEPGRQYLYHLLRTPRYERRPLLRLEHAVRAISGDAEAARRVRASLRLLDDPRSAQLVRLLFGALPRRPKLWWMFPLLSAGAVACVGLYFIWPAVALVLLAICVVNAIVKALYGLHVRAFAPAIHQLPMLVRAAAALGQLQLEEFKDESRHLREGAAELDRLRHASRWLMFESDGTKEVVSTIYEYLNLFFLFDLNAFVLALGSLRESREQLRGMFEAIGYIDAAQSIAAWRSELALWSVPEFAEPAKALFLADLIHPLLAAPVANSLTMANASALITGSNMSGKTTFVRTVGVNGILAQTLHTICGRVWCAPLLRVCTSIGRADTIIEGKSYYLAEVETALAMVRTKETGQQHLFLLDEIFRGTNTTERIAAAYAVLSYLNRGDDLVLVATHDIELIDLLGEAFTPHHFREQVDGNALTFDYRIHAGPSSTRNAIALLELMQFPRDLVADALGTIDWQSRRR
ncbi:MAG: hypothetical protein HYV19_03410 [Gemmatimonadetes bacterium]|nr:hypothetical protein [Gemmatimonadota bacterium]